MYDDFVNIVLRIVAECIPTKTVVLGPKDPEFVTPLVKVLSLIHISEPTRPY